MRELLLATILAGASIVFLGVRYGPAAPSETDPVSSPGERLIDAIAGGDLTTAYTTLQRGIDVNLRSARGFTALMWAADAGDLDLVDRLLREGADVAAVSDGGMSPLVMAGDHVGVLERLIAAGADVDQPIFRGGTALGFAASCGHGRAVDVLLRRDATVDARDCDGRTPLLHAVQHGDESPEVVHRLLACGADPDASDRSGQTPRGVARDAGRTDLLALFDRAVRSGPDGVTWVEPR